MRTARGGRAVLAAVAALLAIVPSAAANIGSTPLVTWQTNGRVLAILDVGGTTYVGGKFTAISDHSGTTTTVSNLAAFDASGDPVAWTPPEPNGTVTSLATDGSGTIFFGGSFTKVGTSGRNHVAAMTTIGALISKGVWAGGAKNGEVDALLADGSNLYMAGTFTEAGGQPRTSLAAVALTDGSLQPWAPFVDGRLDTLAASGSSVVAGGFFLNAGSAAGGHGRLAAFDATTGALQSAYAIPTPSSIVSMTEDGSGSVYVGTANNRVIAFDPTGSAVSWQQQFDGNVQAMAISNGEVIAGGHFANLCDLGTNCTHPVIRNHLAALDPATGDLDTTWAPSVNSDLGVFALADTSIGLVLGGDFTRVGGVDQEHLAWLATGSVAVDSTPPSITAAPDAFLQKATTIAGGSVPMQLRFAATDPSGVCAYHLQRSTGGDPFVSVGLSPATATSKPVTLAPTTAPYRWQVAATDCVGNTSVSSTPGPNVVLVAHQDAGGGIVYTRAWTHATAPKAYGGGIHIVTKPGAYATFRFTGRQVAWVATRAATRGTARVYLDGHLTATVDLHNAATVHRRSVFAHAWAADGAHTIKIVCTGTHGHPAIDVDAILTVR